MSVHPKSSNHPSSTFCTFLMDGFDDFGWTVICAYYVVLADYISLWCVFIGPVARIKAVEVDAASCGEMGVDFGVDKQSWCW